jgi:hypothetical protein
MRMRFFIVVSTIVFFGLHYPVFCADMSFRLAQPPTADGATPGWIVADGDVTIDTAKALRNFVATNKGILDSHAGVLADYVVRMGVDARLLTKASMTEPRSMYLFTTKEMEDYAITLDDAAFSQWKFEPFKGGLIASSNARNGESATLFCRGDRLLRLQIEKAYYGGENDVDELIREATIDLFGVEIPTADITGKANRGRVTLEFKLPPQLTSRKTEDAAWGMGAVGSSRQFFRFALPAKDFGLFAKIVNRNCI